MLRPDYNRYEPKRRNVVDHRKKQFADPAFKPSDYPHRLNFYARPPTADIKLEEFEQWAIDRLKGISQASNLLVFVAHVPRADRDAQCSASSRAARSATSPARNSPTR